MGVSRIVLMGLLWAAFFVLGIQLAGIGPLIAPLATRTGVAIETVGMMFTAQSLASMTSAIMIGPITERFTVRTIILTGMACVATGLFGISNSQTLPALLVSAAIGGLGIPCIDVGGQLFIIRLFGAKSARPLNMLHFMFSLGAVAGPFMAVLIGLDMLLVAVVILAVALPGIFATLPPDTRIGGGATGSPSALYRSPVLWLLATMMLVYVGIEVGVGNWTTEYMADTAATPESTGGYVTSAYWFMFMISRLSITAIGGRLTFERQLLYGGGLALFGALLYVIAMGNEALTIAATLIIGFGFGPIYPAGFAVITRTFSTVASRAAGVIGIVSSIGSMTIVPLQGILLKQGGASLMALYVLVLIGTMLGCYILADRRRNAA